MALIVTCSGIRLNPQAPRLDQIKAIDIAEHLAKQPMYFGATPAVFYSTAQHSELVARETARRSGPEAALFALLHHACDVYGAPADAASAIFGAFGLEMPPAKGGPAALACAHRDVEMSERLDLTHGSEREILALERAGARRLRALVRPLAWDRARDRFLEALTVHAAAARLGRVPAMEDLP